MNVRASLCHCLFSPYRLHWLLFVFENWNAFILHTVLCAFVSWWCAVLFRAKFPTSTSGHISTFCFCAGFTVPGHPWRLWFIVQWQRLGSRLIFSVWRDTFFNTIGLWGCLLCKKHVVFWWHGHGHCCWSISPSAALVHWAVCLFFCHSHGVIGHMALQSHLESKLGQQNLCPVGCSVLSGALCYCGNL